MTNDGIFNGNIYIYYSGKSNKYWWDKVDSTERKVTLNSILDEINSNIDSLSQQLGYIQTLQSQMAVQIESLSNTADFLNTWIWPGQGATTSKDPTTGKITYVKTNTINFGTKDENDQPLYYLAVSQQGIRLQGTDGNQFFGGDSNFTCSKNLIVKGNITFDGSLTGKVYATLA